MKKFTPILILFLLFCNSCMKMNDLNEGKIFQHEKEVLFDMRNNPIQPTKAIIDGTSFTEGNFGVTGYVKASAETAGGYIMQNAKYVATTGVPADGNHYYWPKADDNSDINVKFVAFYPWSTNSVVENDIFKYGESLNVGSVNNTNDILYAIANNVHPELTDNHLIDGATDGNKKVQLTFHHALSLLQFQAKKDSLSKGVKEVIIKSITFGRDSLVVNGKLSINMTDNSTNTNVIPGDEKNIFNFADSVSLTDVYQPLSTTIVIPQEVPDSVVVVFDITIKNGNYEVTYKNRKITRVINTGSDDNNPSHSYTSNWVAGHKYIYRLYFTAADVEFTTSVDDWTVSNDWYQIWDHTEDASVDVF